jgi:hypothetical protein
MADLDIFRGNAFGMGEMTAAIQRIPHQPQRIGQLGLFPVTRLRTEFAVIEEREKVLSIIATSERGDPIATDINARRRKIRQFKTPRLADSATVNAAEIQNWRAFGSFTELQVVQQEIAQRQQVMSDRFDLTYERMRLGAIQGKVLDADSTVLYDWFDEFEVSEAGEIDFDLDNAAPASGALVKKCTQVIRQMTVAGKGRFTMGTRIYAMCGDAFWDDLVAHPEVRATYLNWTAAVALRGEIQGPWQSFTWGGITWENYRGTDDGTTVAINTDKVRFFPVGAMDAFGMCYSPGEWFGAVNQPGLDLYARTVLDPSAGGIMANAAWVKFELMAYPMFMCLCPEMLQRGKRT